MHYAPWLCNFTQPQHTLQMFTDHFGPRQTIPSTAATTREVSFAPDADHNSLTITAGTSFSSFVWFSMRQLAGVPCPREFQALSIFMRALILTGLTTSLCSIHSIHFHQNNTLITSKVTKKSHGGVGWKASKACQPTP